METTGSLRKETEQEAMGSIREAETGDPAPSQGFASPRRGRGSMLARGVLRDSQFPRREGSRLKTPSFGPEAGKATLKAQLAGPPCLQGAASNWLPSLTLCLTTGRFSKSSGPTNGRSIFFMHANISARLPTVATDWYDRITSRDAADGVDKVGNTLPPRQGHDENGDRGS